MRLLQRSGRALVDEAPKRRARPDRGDDRGQARRRRPQIVGYHKLRARRSGSRTLVDLHLQFRAGTTLEDAHEIAHRLRDAIEADLAGSEVLIHVEPEGSFRPDRRDRFAPASRAGPKLVRQQVHQEVVVPGAVGARSYERITPTGLKPTAS